MRSNRTTRTAKQIGPATAARSRVCGAPPLPPTRWSSPQFSTSTAGLVSAVLSGDRLALTAVVAITLAHARKEIRQHPAASVGRAAFADKEFETAAMKPMRFQRLLSARLPTDLVREMRRLVQLAGNEIDVGQLAADILKWRDDEAGDQARTRWAYEYLAAGRDAPGADSPPTPSP